MKDGDFNPFLPLTQKPTLPLSNMLKTENSLEQSELATEGENANFTPAYNNAASPVRHQATKDSANIATVRRESIESSAVADNSSI